jgi:hypothetical protein
MNKRTFLITLFAVLGAGGASGRATAVPPAFRLSTFAGAPNHATSGPDDITSLDGHVFVSWQNGVGTRGEPAAKTHAVDSLVLEYSSRGRILGRWSLKGKVDGIGSDPALDAVVATANEDGNSSLYTIRPGARPAAQVHHFTYSPAPDASHKGAVFSGGGTDSVVVRGGAIFVSASNPGTKKATALFRVSLGRKGIAKLSATFADNASATDGFSGARVKLAITDPDSNALVPNDAGPYAGDLMVAGQADQQLVFAGGVGSGHISLTRLLLTHPNASTGVDESAGVDDVRWVQSDNQTLYVIDNGTNRIYAVKGPFTTGEAFASLDTLGKTGDGTEVDTLNPASGELTPFITGLSASKGLLFMP